MKIAILDMYKGTPNQGLRNIHNVLEQYGNEKGVKLEISIFDVRVKMALPDLSFDAYISSGGPGSPIETEGWEASWVQWMHGLIEHNAIHADKKYAFLICHSFQVMCYQFRLARVCKRKSESYGIFPMHKTLAGQHHKYLSSLPEPFWAVDSRKWQVIEPDSHSLSMMGARILALEKERPHVPLERACMAIQFTQEVFGSQFHPEANAESMRESLNTEEKKNLILENYGTLKYEEMIDSLDHPDKIELTNKSLIPSFLDEVLVHSSDIALKKEFEKTLTN